MSDWYVSSAKWSAVTAWAASTAYSVGDIRRQLATPTVGNERVWRCTTAGTSGGTEPSWTLTKGSTTAEGPDTLVWTEITGDATYNSGNTWYAPHARIRVGLPWMAAGDRMFILNDHNATEAGNVSITTAGTLAAPIQLLCVDTNGALSTGAKETITGSNTWRIYGHHYLEGVNFTLGTTGNPVSHTFTGTVADSAYIKNSDIDMSGNTGGSGGLSVNTTSNSQTGSKVVFENVRVKFGHAGQSVVCATGELFWRGGGPMSGGTSPTSLVNIGGSGRAGNVTLDGLDLTNGAAGMNIFTSSASGSGTGKAVIRNSKLHASWSGALVAQSPAVCPMRYEMWNCDTGDTNYRMWVEDYTGSIKSETTIVKTGGASDGDTPLAWKMASSANAEYPLHILRSPEIYSERITSVGSSKTITVDIVHDSATALKDDEIWVEVQYLGTSGFPISSFVKDAKADVLATAADQAASSVTWTTTGLSAPNKQKLEVTFTPQEKGVAIVTICMAKASYTVYVDPVAQVS